MTEPTKLEKVIAKIRQLRAISESTHSRAERETTIHLAAKLIAEYQLSEAEIVAQGKEGEEIDLTGEHIIYESGRRTLWKNNLAIGLAELNGLFLYNAQVRGGKSHRLVTRYRVIGRKSDIEIALYMMSYLVSTISELADDYVRPTNKRGGNPERESWCVGCVAGFIAKMKAARDAVNQQATSTALVFIGNKAKEAKDAFIAKTGITLEAQKYRSAAQHRSELYHSGYRKGQTLNVNPGMGTSGGGTKKLGG